QVNVEAKIVVGDVFVGQVLAVHGTGAEHHSTVLGRGYGVIDRDHGVAGQLPNPEHKSCNLTGISLEGIADDVAEVEQKSIDISVDGPVVVIGEGWDSSQS